MCHKCLILVISSEKKTFPLPFEKQTAGLISNYQNRKGSDFNKALSSSINCECNFLNIFKFLHFEQNFCKRQEIIVKVFKSA